MTARRAAVIRGLNIEGHHWRYDMAGHGDDTLLLLTGGAGEGNPIADTLGPLADEIVILAPVYPPLATIEQLLSGIVWILDREGISKAHMFGASLGGAIAQCLVRRHPDRVKSLMLANTAAPVPWAGPLVRTVRGVFRALPGGWLVETMKKKLTKTMASSKAERPAVRRKIDETMAGFAKVDLLAMCDYVADYHSHYRFTNADLSGWPGRVLIIESEDDPMVPRRHRERLKRLYPNAKVHTFAAGGHAPGLHDPAAMLDLMQGFLSDRIARS
ncbi:MAG: alpha/beta hydrolase [Gemmatimonadetes bacterium]|nr:alpha/beta hydrolase [Gemmatimonadota bacterium]